MPKGVLLDSTDKKYEDTTDLGRGLTLEINKGVKTTAVLYRHGTFLKATDLSDKIAKRLLVLEAVDLGAKKARLSIALNISRQTIHNYEESRKHFGLEGLIHNYSPGRSKSRRKQRETNTQKHLQGNKARQLEEIRRRARQEREAKQSRFNFSFEHKGEEEKVNQDEQPFSEEHDWEDSRYAGVFIYLIALITEWKWLSLVLGYFGRTYKILMVFILMAARNIRSIEQLKNIRRREAGVILGIKRLPHKLTVWEWFYSAANKENVRSLISDYFSYQIQTGIVGIWLWFTDGHLLPYTGKNAVRFAYNTQRRMPVPGQTSMVTCDGSGRIVDFEIQEGKGDLRKHILSLGMKWKDEVTNAAVMVFDREGDGAGFFSDLVKRQIPFVTWEKNADSKKLEELDDELFSHKFEFCGKKYGIFEDEKPFIYEPEGEERHHFTLRRIYVWNKTSRRRAAGLAWSANSAMSTEDCALAILSRWGASENTFKHLNERHPLHYHPGFKLVKSENQEIANPAIKEKTGLINQLK
ncbi:MAG: helix-turn-helix domain-containing protein, partial [Gammaproteobacteria bacterium]|nr:helix-turn-helix domain-containing protein [Gammaproteobacteria bacterium]